MNVTQGVFHMCLLQKDHIVHILIHEAAKTRRQLRLYFHAIAARQEENKKTLIAPQDNDSSIVIHLRFNTIFT